MGTALITPPNPREPLRPARRLARDPVSLPTLAASCARALRAFGGSLQALDAVLRPLAEVIPTARKPPKPAWSWRM